MFSISLAEILPFSLELLPKTAYLVGGAVRDALLGRKREYIDLDFVLPENTVNIAHYIAQQYQAGFVLLDAERQIARVVFKQATIDFAQQEGNSLEIDLHRRDFTINAMAYNLHTKEFVDPLQGYNDLKSGMIKMVSKSNLLDDPLRLLRAYRQAAQLAFMIEPNTRLIIRELAPQLSNIAAERVQAELSYLLNIPEGTAWIIAAAEDGLLPVWFPNITTERLDLLTNIDHTASILAANWSELENLLFNTLSDTVKTSWLAMAKLSTLLSDIPAQAETQLLKLKYSRAEIRAVTIALKYLPQMSATVISEMSLRDQYFFFLAVGNVFPILALLAVTIGLSITAIAPLMNRYLNLEDQVAHPTALLTGNDLMQSLNLRPGRQIGQILTEIQIARAEGKISTPAEALKFVSQLLDIK